MRMTRWALPFLIGFVVTSSFAAPPAPLPRIHPRVFDLIVGWSSDDEDLVATEINLDAVAKNANQFDFTEVRQDGDWVTCPNDEGQGFLRFRPIPCDTKSHAVEFQSNGGGTWTTANVIEFVIDQRTVLKQGKPQSLRVLRVTAISQK